MRIVEDEQVRDGGMPPEEIVNLFGQRSLAGYWEGVRSNAVHFAQIDVYHLDKSLTNQLAELD